ncbi:peptidoglycan DD-metalloendopeptidase family protein [Streptomyces sp. NBC_00091]|uniref:peptidoglycan DD-metalloendopeptidase family protein n=1 Tax=Streptomyces sp. NBC_00091 TaxID=2975648 RepID=UPI00225B35C5|nr:peptidoglycan DD-metalloendopeptidase family protein [Streptomyces sp. NBC_00091]MCX5377003.1 peptidoglycan DD-metalloendopeptidase family protein [Streptomyces sp. NBC_00091]
MDVQETPTAGAWGEWNPTEDSARPVRGKHRVLKARGGLARSSTVLGVGVIAAVGAGGIATAQDRPQVAISMPSIPDLLGGGGHSGSDGGAGAEAVSQAAAEGGASTAGVPRQADAGEALRNRILQQAETEQDAVEAQARADAERTARESAAQEARTQREAADKEAEAARVAAEKAAAEKAAADKAAAEQTATKAAADTGAGAGTSTGTGSGTKASGGYSLPTSSYTLTSHYGAAGSMWSSGYHTGLDFAAPTGTPVKAVGGGKVISAGWSGAYGYRIVLQLADGTEVWYCHLSSMSVTSGSVGAGETIGRVGATGNVTGAHLHLEVRKGGSTVDPLAWLNSKGLDV